MTIFNNIFSNSDIMFYSVFAGTACLLTGSLIKSIFYPTNIQTIIETPTSDSGINTIGALTNENLLPSPTLHHLTQGNIRHLQNVLELKRDISTQTNFSTEVSYADAGVQASQTLFTKLEQGIQTIDGSNLGVPSVDLINFIEESIDIPVLSTKINNNLRINISSDSDFVTPEMIQNMTKHNEILSSGLDCNLIEAYMTIPELIEVADSVYQFYP
jgi:hypothetical protein